MKKLNTLLFAAMPVACLFSLSSCNKTQKPENTGESKAPVELADSGDKTLSPDELVSKGEHLVAVAGCDDCHSPKKYEKGMPMPDMSLRLSGHHADMKLGPSDPSAVKNGWVMTNNHFTAWVGPWGTSFSANLTPDTATGIGNWTEGNFFKVMREGKYGGTDRGRMLLPPMPWPDFKNYTDEELKAIFAYLKSLKPIKNAVPAPLPPKGA